MARKSPPAAAEPEMVPDPTYGWAGVKPESIRPWQPVPLGHVTIVAEDDPKPPRGATISEATDDPDWVPEATADITDITDAPAKKKERK